MSDNSRLFNKLSVKDFPELKTGDHVFITCPKDGSGAVHRPGIVWGTCDGIASKSFTVMVPTDEVFGGLYQVRYNPDQNATDTYLIPLRRKEPFKKRPAPEIYHDDIIIEKPAGFTVDTPHGRLKIYDKQDEEYPGVCVDMENPDKSKSDTTMCWVEYIPGGEGICDYNPGINGASETERQKREVPPERMRHNKNTDSVTAGIVTRAWPNESEQEDFHVRTFHYGYPIAPENTQQEDDQNAE